jgi:cytochrome c551/c552
MPLQDGRLLVSWFGSVACYEYGQILKRTLLLMEHIVKYGTMLRDKFDPVFLIEHNYNEPLEVAMKKSLVLMMLVLVLALVACGGGDSESSDAGSDTAAGPSAAHGEELYNQVTIGPSSAPGCVTCHSMEPDVVLVGPSHNGIGARAGTYVAGVSAEEYLQESIKEPDAHLVEGFAAGIMYQNYAAELDQSDIDDLVAFLLTK